jgi:hypothetical protein
MAVDSKGNAFTIGHLYEYSEHRMRLVRYIKDNKAEFYVEFAPDRNRELQDKTVELWVGGKDWVHIPENINNKKAAKIFLEREY